MIRLVGFSISGMPIDPMKVIEHHRSTTRHRKPKNASPRTVHSQASSVGWGLGDSRLPEKQKGSQNYSQCNVFRSEFKNTSASKTSKAWFHVWKHQFFHMRGVEHNIYDIRCDVDGNRN